MELAILVKALVLEHLIKEILEEEVDLMTMVLLHITAVGVEEALVALEVISMLYQEEQHLLRYTQVMVVLVQALLYFLVQLLQVMVHQDQVVL